MNRDEKIMKLLAIFQGMASAAKEDIGDLEFTMIILDDKENKVLILSSQCVVCANKQLSDTIEEQGIEHVINEVEEWTKH